MLPNCDTLRSKEISGSTMRVVIGAGADALRAAATLAAAGEAVLLLQAAETPHGLAHPDLPEGTGRLSIDESMRETVERVTGPLRVEEPALRAVSRAGRLARLPMSLAAVPRLFPSNDLAGVGRQFVYRRIRNAIIPLTGGGQEERTYRQWVERRMGQDAYLHAYESYACRRWGLRGEELSVAVARLHHNPHGFDGASTITGGFDEFLTRAVQRIEDSGGEVRCQSNVRGFKVEDGRVVAVRVGRRHIPVEGPVWVARPHSIVAEWLGDALYRGARVDAASLVSLDRLQVAFPYDADLSADEIHILDKSAPAWRVSRVPGGRRTIVFHSNLPSDAPVPDLNDFVALGMGLGLAGLEAENARVERLSGWAPVWAPVVHPRLRRLSLAFADLGVVSVGRRGTFAPLDPGTEVVLASRYAAEDVPDQREALRALLAPPVRDNDLSASFRDFLWR